MIKIILTVNPQMFTSIADKNRQGFEASNLRNLFSWLLKQRDTFFLLVSNLNHQFERNPFELLKWPRQGRQFNSTAICISRIFTFSLLQAYQKLNGLQEKDAKVRYIQKCRSLPTYGITFFLIKASDYLIHDSCTTYSVRLIALAAVRPLESRHKNL